MQLSYKQKFSSKAGYTLLFAVLVSALVLAIGISILNISKKEFLLSSGARESSIAIYAADSGIECAYYYDTTAVQSNGTTRVDPFTPATNSQNNLGQISCFNPMSWQTSWLKTDAQHSTSTFSFGKTGSYCTFVQVMKYPKIVNSTVVVATSIVSHGFNLGWSVGPDKDNTCDPNNVDLNYINVKNPKKVERILHLDY